MISGDPKSSPGPPGGSSLWDQRPQRRHRGPGGPAESPGPGERHGGEPGARLGTAESFRAEGPAVVFLGHQRFRCFFWGETMLNIC